MEKSYSRGLRKRLVTLLDTGMSASAAGRRLMVARSTTTHWTWIWRQKQRCKAQSREGNTAPPHLKGTQKKERDHGIPAMDAINQPMCSGPSGPSRQRGRPCFAQSKYKCHAVTSGRDQPKHRQKGTRGGPDGSGELAYHSETGFLIEPLKTIRKSSTLPVTLGTSLFNNPTPSHQSAAETGLKQ